jgi:putative membrane protein
MAQHEILMLGAAPLLVPSRPLVPMLHGMPFAWRRALGRVAKAAPAQKMWHGLTGPFTPGGFTPPHCGSGTSRNSSRPHSTANGCTPRSMPASLSRHSCSGGRFFMDTGSRLGQQHRLCVYNRRASILGALLTLSPRLWYPDYAGTTSAWRLTPLEDQELGGLIMWVPASMIYPGVGLALLAAWLRQSENSLAAARQTEISSRYA